MQTNQRWLIHGNGSYVHPINFPTVPRYRAATHHPYADIKHLIWPRCGSPRRRVSFVRLGMHGSVRPRCFSDSVDDVDVASVAAELAARSRISACDRSAGQNGLLTSAVAALGQPAFASSIIATPDMICPDVQNPHWKPSCSTNSAWTGRS